MPARAVTPIQRRLFDERAWREPRAYTWLRYAVVTLLVVQGELALVSGWRAVVQVRRLALHAPGHAVGGGDTLALRLPPPTRDTLRVVLR